LRDASGKDVRVESVVEKPGKVRVYNFEVEGTHTYYASGLWVHNTCPLPAQISLGLGGEGWRRSRVLLAPLPGGIGEELRRR
jgi:hypothetical protein